MTVLTTIRPNGTTSTSGSPSIGGGAASMNAAVSDNADTTYIRFPAGVSGSVKLDMGTVSIPSGARVTSITPRVRSNASTPTLKRVLVEFNWIDSLGNVRNNFSTYINGGDGVQQTVAGAAFTEPMNQSSLDGLQVVLRLGNATTANVDVTEVYLDVAYDEPAVVSAVAVSSVAASSPVISWTVTDPENLPTVVSQLAVFTAAQYGIGGFDPATSPSVDRHYQKSSTTSTPVAASLVNGTVYRAYVRVATYGDPDNTYPIQQPYWSAWAYVQWTVSLVPAVTPTLTATADDVNRRQVLTIQGLDTGGNIAKQKLEIERSSDSGVTFHTLPRLWDGSAMVDGSNLDVSDVTQLGVFYDYEAPRHSTVRYRARSRIVDGTNNVYSAWTSTVTPTAQLASSRWVLKCLTDPTKSIVVNNGADRVEWTDNERQSVLTPLGRKYPIVLSDSITADSGTLSLVFLDSTSFRAFEALRALRQTVLLQSPYGDNRYCRFIGARTSSHFSNGSGLAKRTVTITVQEVDRP